MSDEIERDLTPETFKIPKRYENLKPEKRSICSIKRTKSENYSEHIRRMRDRGAAKETKKIIRKGTVAERKDKLLQLSNSTHQQKPVHIPKR